MTQAQLPARFANRQNRRQLATAVTAGLGMASPPYVSINGGQFTLVDAAGNQEPVETKHLDCVIFDANLEVPTQRVFWGIDPRTGQVKAPSPGTPPVCFSDNGVGASRNAAEPQSPNCSSCAQDEWGSAISKRTGDKVKACNVMKKVAVLPVQVQIDQKGKPVFVEGGEVVIDSTEEFPFVLRVPVMSHDNLRAYGDKFKGQEFDVSEVITRITFVQGKVGVLDFAAVGFTDVDTDAKLEKLLAEKKTDWLIGRGDVPVSAELPAPKPVAQVAPPADKKGSGKKGAQTPPQAAPDDGLPPFLRRAEQPQGNGTAPQSGIVTNAPPPNADLAAALDRVFKLPT